MPVLHVFGCVSVALVWWLWCKKIIIWLLLLLYNDLTIVKSLKVFFSLFKLNFRSIVQEKQNKSMKLHDRLCLSLWIWDAGSVLVDNLESKLQKTFPESWNNSQNHVLHWLQPNRVEEPSLTVYFRHSGALVRKLCNNFKNQICNTSLWYYTGFYLLLTYCY